MALRLTTTTAALMMGMILSSSVAAFGASCQMLKVQRYFDGSLAHSQGPYYISIQDGKIDSIGSRAPKKNSPCRVIDLGHMTAAPGLIDVHTHVLLTDRTFGVDFSKELMAERSMSHDERVSLGKKALRSLLRSGFTSIRDLGNSGKFGDLALRSEVQNQSLDAPRIFASGPGIAIGVGQFPKGTGAEIVGEEYRIIKSPDEAKRIVAGYRDQGVDLIKVYADADPQPELTPQEILSAVVEAAHANGLRVAAHATQKESAYRAVVAGVDSVEHGYQLDERTLSMMEKRGTFLVANDFNSALCEILARHDPDPVYHPISRYRDLRAKRLIAAHHHGIRIAFGSDMYLALEGALSERGPATIETLLAYGEEGLSPVEVLRAATANGASLLGRRDLGQIEVGATADLVAFARNPVENLEAVRNVAFVMKDGKRVCQNDTPGVEACTK